MFSFSSFIFKLHSVISYKLKICVVKVVGDIKAKTKTADLCKDLPQEFVKYLDYVKKLHFKSQPDYKYLKQMFQKLGKENNVRYNENDWDWSDQNNKDGRADLKQS